MAHYCKEIECIDRDGRAVSVQVASKFGRKVATRNALALAAKHGYRVGRGNKHVSP